MDFLATMAAHSRARARRTLDATSLEALRDQALERPPPPPLALSPEGFDLIAEVKLRAPSTGALSGPVSLDDLVARAGAYARAGAAAISVLTEDSRFDGSLEHLAAVAGALDTVPAMRKDFLVDPCQVYEARLAGAGGVLLIARMLDDEAMATMISTARQCRLFVLLEAFDDTDLERIGRCDPGPDLLVGLNCRDLATLAVDVDRFATLIDAFPPGLPAVAESGVATADDAAGVARLGYRVALVGTALMRCDEPGGLVRAMLEAGRG